MTSCSYNRSNEMVAIFTGIFIQEHELPVPGKSEPTPLLAIFAAVVGCLCAA